jgi:hypothetical protein
MLKEDKKEKKPKYIGIVNIDGFKVRGKEHPRGSEYDCKDKKSYDILKKTNKIK